MKPQFKNICFDPCARSPFCQRCYIVFSSKRPDLAPEQNNDRKNRSQLDHDLEHAVKFITYFQFDHFIQQNQMPGTADVEATRSRLPQFQIIQLLIPLSVLSFFPFYRSLPSKSIWFIYSCEKSGWVDSSIMHTFLNYGKLLSCFF